MDKRVFQSGRHFYQLLGILLTERCFYRKLKQSQLNLDFNDTFCIGSVKESQSSASINFYYTNFGKVASEFIDLAKIRKDNLLVVYNNEESKDFQSFANYAVEYVPEEDFILHLPGVKYYRFIGDGIEQAMEKYLPDEETRSQVLESLPKMLFATNFSRDFDDYVKFVEDEMNFHGFKRLACFDACYNDFFRIEVNYTFDEMKKMFLALVYSHFNGLFSIFLRVSESELKRLESMNKKGLVVSGKRGIGKTQFVMEYVYYKKQEYKMAAYLTNAKETFALLKIHYRETFKNGITPKALVDLFSNLKSIIIFDDLEYDESKTLENFAKECLQYSLTMDLEFQPDIICITETKHIDGMAVMKMNPYTDSEVEIILNTLLPEVYKPDNKEIAKYIPKNMLLLRQIVSAVTVLYECGDIMQKPYTWNNLVNDLESNKLKFLNPPMDFQWETFYDKKVSLNLLETLWKHC